MAQIVNRHARDDFRAFVWATAAANIGWRVVACFPSMSGTHFCVWAEAPDGSDPDEWDREIKRSDPERKDGE